MSGMQVGAIGAGLRQLTSQEIAFVVGSYATENAAILAANDKEDLWEEQGEEYHASVTGYWENYNGPNSDFGPTETGPWAVCWILDGYYAEYGWTNFTS